MKLKKFLYIIIIINIFAIIVFSNNNVSLGKIPTDNFTITRTNQVDDVGNGILSVVQFIGIVMSVAALMIIGIKYILGSAEEKSQEKERLIYYIIGAILVLCITTVVPFIYKIAQDLF